MKKGKSTTLILNGYAEFLGELKQRIASARLSAARVVSNEMILLYWDIGRGIVEKQKTLGWGESVIEMIAKDLRPAFPRGAGFSPRNLRNMKQFYLTYVSSEFWQQAVAKLETGVLPAMTEEVPWGHHILVLNKVEAPAARLYYLQATGWSSSFR